MFGVIGPRGLGAFVAVLVVVAACVPLGVDPSVPDPAPPSASASASPSASAPPSFIRPTPNPSPTFVVYEVRAGDTLTSIARQFGTTARSIAYWNRGRYPSLDPDSSTYEPDRIETGWILQLIPTAVVDEDELPEPTPTPSPAAGSSPPAGAGSPPTDPSGDPS
jgi:hypothetical protein